MTIGITEYDPAEWSAGRVIYYAPTPPKTVLSRAQIEATRYRADGNFWCADVCSRCVSTFYTHAMQNRGWNAYEHQHPMCPWCRGECSAAEQDRRNAKIEAAQ